MPRWRPLRKATARDRRRAVNYFNGPAYGRSLCCLAEDDGWECALLPRHRGNHEAWADDGKDGGAAHSLCHEWPRAGRAG